jgi:hypothetical protein
MRKIYARWLDTSNSCISLLVYEVDNYSNLVAMDFSRQGFTLGCPITSGEVIGEGAFFSHRRIPVLSHRPATSRLVVLGWRGVGVE